ncbi:glycine cleavage system aminomethyltransferase GcvT [Sphingopyxis indica]|uniref:glycine cleavage system aminomethyltransferase GcvT n=1 Tax=Sphingopyxis indica TaxID=436663 RepID=UPI002938EC38|nr:glycine cleavage system aminomethyltransferase GcvT [Sphingopyxis indica]WOF44494.1 glycine cleavage system aminomethyltransferase GcvT [Sphingopyxis indica]
MSEIGEIDEEAAIEALPLDAWHRARGARMVEFAGYHMPIQYEGIMAEHLWTRDSAGLFDVSHMGQLVLSGEGAAEALEALVPGDISALKPGRMRYSLLLAEDGGILDDLMITNTGRGLYLVVNGAVKWDDIAHLREHLPDEIEMNLLDDHALLALQGPKAVEALVALGVAPEFADILPVDRLVFMQAGAYLWGDVRLGISRSGYTGEDGFEISVPAEQAEALADALCALETVKPIGLGARDSLRLEAGLPLYGHDLDEAIDPVEGDLSFAISKRRREEGGFPGAARILGHLTDGSPRKRVGLSVEGKLPVREGAKLFDGNREVGIVTSGGFAPSVGAPIAMGYVPRGSAAPGTALAAEVRGKRIPVTVAALPFVPHRYVRKTGA